MIKSFKFTDKDMEILLALKSRLNINTEIGVVRYCLGQVHSSGANPVLREEPAQIGGAALYVPKEVVPTLSPKREITETFKREVEKIHGRINYNELSEEDFQFLEDSLPKYTGMVDRYGEPIEVGDEFGVKMEITRGERLEAAKENITKVINPETKMTPNLEALLKEQPALPKQHDEPGILADTAPENWEGRDQIYDEN